MAWLTQPSLGPGRIVHLYFIFPIAAIGVYIINLVPSRLYNKTSRLIMLSSMHSDFIFICKSCEYQEKVTPTSSLSTLLVQMSNIDIPYCRVTCPGCRANLFLCLLCDKYNYNCLASRIFLIKQHITTCQLHINQSSLQLIAIRYITFYCSE